MSQSLESDPERTGSNRNKDGTFRNGISGNIKGRPKGVQQIPDILRKIGEEEGSVDGMTKLEVVLRKVFGFAVEGSAWAVHFIAERTEGKVRQELQVGMIPEVIFTPIEDVTEDEWNARIVESNAEIIVSDAEQLSIPEEVN
tara:strand:+ start:1009 stop:1434 length:426 start_codon:yes stop_codon:yes gene_type:complete